MNTILRTRLLSSLIFFMLIASAVFTVPARADGGSPPPAPTGAGGTGPAHTTAQGTSGVTNTSGAGHTVELGSQAAAHVSAAGDPLWCPSSLGAPTPGAHSCTINYPDLAGLTAYLASNQKTVDGTIWINGGGPDASSPTGMDGTGAFATMALHKLTLKGGWTGIGGAINPLNPSIFSSALAIGGWINDITVSDVQFNNNTNFPDLGRGLVIATRGNITLTRVEALDDMGIGALLDNRSGTGSVSIMNSQFNNDATFFGSHSLEVYSNNVINLTNVVAISSDGVLLDNSTASNKAITIKSGLFDNHAYNGLEVVSMGPITLTNVSVSGNGGVGIGYGASLDNSSSITAAPVTLTGINNFNYNGTFGILVLSAGKITSVRSTPVTTILTEQTS